MFQHTAARRRLHAINLFINSTSSVSTHSRAEAAARTYGRVKTVPAVSTHSRAEAAAGFLPVLPPSRASFNTQPRGGGCQGGNGRPKRCQSFNTQPRGGGCVLGDDENDRDHVVSTHSRAEAAAHHFFCFFPLCVVSTHSRAEAAAALFQKVKTCKNVSTHSRAEAAAVQNTIIRFPVKGFNTQPRGGGC